MIYVYDGTWNGMMALVHRTALEGAPEDILRSSSVLPDATAIVPDERLAGAVDAALSSRIGRRALRDAQLALMSGTPGGEGGDGGMDLAVWRYLEQLWRLGRRASRDLADPCIGRVFHAARAVAREYDRWRGLVRFQEAGGFYYAPFEPSSDVLPLLAGHFAKRLPDPWVLHDLRRGRAALHDRGRWIITDALPDGLAARITKEEQAFRELWREFYCSAAIRERANPRCQANFIPLWMRKHLIERPGESARA